MTEQEWLACEEPQKMLEFLQGKVSDRKLRLFGCACCRQLLLWDWYGEQDVFEEQIQVAERFAEGEATDEERLKAYRELMPENEVRIGHPQRTWDERTVSTCLEPSTSEAAQAYVRVAWYNVTPRIVESSARASTLEGRQAERVLIQQDEWKRFAGLLRHIVSNPFHRYPAPRHWPLTVVQLFAAFQRGEDCGFAFHDALLDAGYLPLAQHFQDEQQHPKGWVVDLLLGKE